MYQFVKAAIPTEESEKADFLDKLLKFGVSLKQYQSAYVMEDVTMYVLKYVINVQCYKVLFRPFKKTVIM